MEGSSTESLPYWLVNVPQEQWPAECPEYLKNLSEKDEKHLAVRDEDYRWLTWEEVCDIVATNRLDAFYRLPSDLRRYRWYCWTLVRDYGSVMNFMLWERLKWSSLEPTSQVPFACEEHEWLIENAQDDYKILLNDWPYGIDKRIVHLVVWTKTRVEVDKTTGELTTAAQDLIETFVRKTFLGKVDREKLIWFLNPPSLRSVQAVEHFHIMIFEPSPHLVVSLTNQDTPLSQSVGREPHNKYL